MTKQEIEQLKSSVRIEEVAGRYVKLERKGRNYTALCPFHEDHHPSLVVNPERQTFHCFACGEHGDAIAFVQKAERCSFGEAVRQLTVDRGQVTVDNGQVTGGRKRNIHSDAKQLSTVTCPLSPELSPVNCQLKKTCSFFPPSCLMLAETRS